MMKMMQRSLSGWRLPLVALPLLAVLILVLAASLELPGTAHAQSGVTAAVTVASPVHLIARTTVQISGTATCTLPAGATLLGSAGGDVTISQASGRQIVQADSGFFSLTSCDGTVFTFQVFATPPAGSAPFHGGPAIATGTLSFDWIDALGNDHEEQLFTDPQAISIQG
jgi:hypothetical protein